MRRLIKELSENETNELENHIKNLRQFMENTDLRINLNSDFLYTLNRKGIK